MAGRRAGGVAGGCGRGRVRGGGSRKKWWICYYMQEAPRAIDSNPLFRYLHLHCFIHLYRVLTSPSEQAAFGRPRFGLFRRIERLYHAKEKNQLFLNLLFTYLPEIVAAVVVTLVYASLNLLVPELIRQFMHFMREKHLERREYGDFIEKFIVIQLLRIFFSEHSKRLFHELAIKVESTLARKLVSKSLRMAKECRDRIPESEIIQLENVDLRLIFTLFRNMNIIFEAPFTIVVAIILLFNESSHYGFIGVYWFLIAFLLQRELDGRMMHCNQTKLGLIEKRSNLNYDLFGKIREAKLIGWESLLTEKNNDLFIEENHDHDLFYSYATLYDITLLMLPIFVVSTITLYDVNEEDPITVEQVYLMLSLLGICYNPMKSVRTISISLHDGLHSLRRLGRYFHFPEEIKSTLIDAAQGTVGELYIQEGTVATYPHSSSNFDIKTGEWSILVQPGERLTLIGKKRSGCSSFLEMLVGSLKRVRGKIYMRGRVSYLPQKHFFLKDTVKENIRFFGATAPQQVEELYNELGLSQDLRFDEDLQTVMDDSNKFTKTVLKKIALARVLASDADLYILDSPFNDVDDEVGQVVERRLRELQRRGKTVVLSLRHLDKYTALEDHIIILDEGSVVEYGHFTELLNTYESSIRFFCISLKDGQEIQEPRTGVVEMRFQERARSAVNFDIKSAVPSRKTNPMRLRNAPLARLGLRLREEERRERAPASENFERMVMRFLGAVSFKETVFLLLIILAAEVLHIFIHFYIGHLEEEYGNDDYTKYKNLMIAEVVLTFCLAGLIYLEGEISTILAVAIGNRLYEQSFEELGKKRLSWYGGELSVKLADKYNHDYEEVFIACHSILGIYKNLVILIATIEFISTNRSKLIAIFVVLSSIYYSIFHLFRKVERRIVKHYYDYKYNYVRSLEESIQGAELFNICGLKAQVLARAEEKYEQLASYKLAESYTAYGLSLVCDMLSITLLTIGIEYGIEMKIHHREQRISVIATSIFLLMNISEVLKTIIREMLTFETFFSINLLPFIEIADAPRPLDDEEEVALGAGSLGPAPSFAGHRLEFHNLLLEEPGEALSSNHIFSLVVEEGEVVLLYEKDNRFRDLLLYALTKNLPMFNERAFFKSKSSTIRLGGVDIRECSRRQWLAQFGLIASENFYFNASVRENVSWGLEGYSELRALHFARVLQIEKDFPAEPNVLSARLTTEMKRIKNGLIKKIALLRVLLRRPKVVVLKDTDEYIETLSIVELLRQEIPAVTIIKISNFLEASLDVTRIVSMENMEILEDGHPADIKAHSRSKLGDDLRDVNYASYHYRKKGSEKRSSDRPSH